MKPRAFLHLLFSTVVFSGSYFVGSSDGADAATQIPSDVEWQPDIEYRNGNPKWTLDLAAPKDRGGPPRPGIVFVHGGGWRGGDKGGGQWRRLPIEYAQKGYVCITVNYRLTDEAPFPACLEDVKCAVRWFRAHAEEYHLDPERIGAYGNSAGAHLVSMLGLVDRDKDLEGDGPYRRQSSLVQAVFCSAVPTDFADWHVSIKGHRALEPFLAGPERSLAERVRQASPIHYVSSEAPPFFVLHGTSDTTVNVRQADRFVEALHRANARDVSYARVEGVGHGVFGQRPEISGPAMETFFSRTIGKGFESLFDGKTLDGWQVRGGTAAYQVENGTIVGRTAEGSPNSFLSTTEDYGDFELVVDVRCDPSLNSGIQIRSHVYEKDTPQASRTDRIRKAGEVYGYQCETASAERGTSGNFWDEARRTKWLDDFDSKTDAKGAFREGEWNRYRIVAQGDRIRSWVNGIPCADFQDSTDAAGFIGLQVHSIQRDTGPYEVRWRNVMIRSLSGNSAE